MNHGGQNMKRRTQRFDARIDILGLNKMMFSYSGIFFRVVGCERSRTQQQLNTQSETPQKMNAIDRAIEAHGTEHIKPRFISFEFPDGLPL